MPAAKLCLSAGEQHRPFAASTQSQLLVCDQLSRCRRVVKFDHVQFRGTYTRGLISKLDHPFEHRGFTLGTVMARHYYRRTEGHRLRYTRLARSLLRHHHRRRAVADPRAHRQRQRWRNDARGEHLLAGHRFAVLRPRIQSGKGMALRRHDGKSCGRGAAGLMYSRVAAA